MTQELASGLFTKPLLVPDGVYSITSVPCGGSGQGEPVYEHQILIESYDDAFVAHGDSGSLVAGRKGGEWHPIGIVMALTPKEAGQRSGRLGLVNPLAYSLFDISQKIGCVDSILTTG